MSLPTFPPINRLGVGKVLGKDTDKDSWPKLTEGITQWSLQKRYLFQIWKLGKEGGKGGIYSLQHLLSIATTIHAGPLLPRNWPDTTCWYNNKTFVFSFLLHVQMQPFVFDLVSCLVSTYKLLSVLFSVLSANERGDRVAKVNPPQYCKFLQVPFFYCYNLGDQII